MSLFSEGGKLSMEKALLYTYTVVRAAGEEFKDRTPYIDAILETAEGKRFACLIQGNPEEFKAKIGEWRTYTFADNGEVVMSKNN